MGTIRKQSIYSSIYIYIGFAIGAMNFLWLLPRFFSKEEIGLTRLVMEISLLFSTFCTIGAVPVSQKFFPFYNSYLNKKQNDLPFITVTFSVIGCTLFLIATTLFKVDIVRKFGSRSPLFVTHFNLIYPLTLSLAFFSLLESFAWAIRKSVLSNFLKEVSYRLLTTVLIVLYVYHVVTLEVFFSLYAYIYVPSVVILVIAVVKSGNFRFNFSISSVTKRLYRKMLTFGLFIFSGSVLNVLSRTISGIIIASQSINGLADATLFMLPTFLVTIMDVPQRSMAAVATPIIAEAWKDRNTKKIHEIYQKTSLNLLIMGLALGGAIYLNMDNAVLFLGPDYAPIKQIALILGIAKLIDLGTGLNAYILLLSKYWKIDFGTNMLFVFITIPLNYYLIKTDGVIGAAYADLIGIAVYNAVRFAYIWYLFKIQPFNLKVLYALLIGFAAIFIVYHIPFMVNLYVDAVVRSLIYLLLFAPAIVFLNISQDITELYGHALNRLKRKN